MKRAARYQRPRSTATSFIPPERLKVIEANKVRRKKTRYRLYGRAWSKYREGFLKKPENALCVKCLQLGRIVATEEVDHIIPHCGDHNLFWDRANHQGLCKSCHSRKTAGRDGGFGNRTAGGQ